MRNKINNNLAALVLSAALLMLGAIFLDTRLFIVGVIMLVAGIIIFNAVGFLR